jgi:glycosyltransferase involved in cell wall biosynthesis
LLQAIFGPGTNPLPPDRKSGDHFHMRVAHIFLSLPVGGAEDLLALLLRHPPEGVEMHVLCLRALGPVGEELRQQGYSVELLPLAPSKRPRLLAFWRLAQWLRARHIDLVHTHVYNSHVFGGIAALLAGIPFVLHHHKTFSRLRWRRRMLLRWLGRRAAHHLTLSNQTAADISSAFDIPRDRFLSLPNPIDGATFHAVADRTSLRLRLGYSPGDVLIGTAASLSSPKNHDLNLALVHNLEANGFVGHFLLFGEGPLEQELRAKALKQKLTRLDFMGSRRPLAPWLQILDLFVLASSWEGQPMVLLQAMACDLPIVASRIEGNVDVLGSDHPGLFTLGDVQDYSTKVQRVLEDPTFRERLRKYQHQRLSSWPSATAYSRRLGDLYKTLHKRQL